LSFYSEILELSFPQEILKKPNPQNMRDNRGKRWTNWTQKFRYLILLSLHASLFSVFRCSFSVLLSPGHHGSTES